MRRPLLALLACSLPFVASSLTGCAAGPTVVQPGALDPTGQARSIAGEPLAAYPPGDVGAELRAAQESDAPPAKGPWIGAAGASDLVMAGTSDTVLGVWVDVPRIPARQHAPADVALVIDTSGSMAGPKMENARTAALALVDKLHDGDILSISTFANEASVRLDPTILNPMTRRVFRGVIAGLQPSGGTNMFDGLTLAEQLALRGPATHPVRRVVVISDGMANIGPSSTEVLGALAARGSDRGAQVTAIGVGLDYDERTLDALAVRSSGRLYHVNEPGELPPIMDREIALLQQSAATGASIEIVPAAGVELLGIEGVRADRDAMGTVRVPLGTMFGGQHRELALKVRVHAQGEGSRPLASVRLRFKDPSDGNLDRVQEVVARYQVAGSMAEVEARRNDRTRAIVASQDAAQAQLFAAQQVNDGRYDDADKKLAAAENHLREEAVKAKNDSDRQRMMASAARVGQARASAKAAAAAPPAAAPAARRARALDMNQAAMKDAGF